MAKALSTIFTSIFILCSFSAFAVTDADELQLPAVPDTITSIPARADYVMAHFWDNLDISRRPERVASPQWLEQSVVNFMSLLPHATSEGHTEGFRAMIDSFAPDHSALTSATLIVEKYLDDPESPMFSESHYIAFLQQLTTAGVLDRSELVRPLYQLDALRKNRVGTIATDFTYTDRNNVSRSLYTTVAPQLLLIIYDPDCDHCADTMRIITSDTTLSDRINSGLLSVLAVYADGDPELWRSAADALPDQWLGGLDTTGLQENDLYTIRELPSIYLLDADKTVLLKEPTTDQLHHYLLTSPATTSTTHYPSPDNNERK
ncbi:MAG: DUF5106 domain-containing protein [Muribaculum sp.]|nr:DUF5106 domain-containing protein [Muribaculum sp.]